MSETTTNSPEMQDAVDRIGAAVSAKTLAVMFDDDAMWEKAWGDTVQAALDIAALMRAGEPAPPEMPEDPEVFLEAYPEGATVESIRAEQETEED